MVYKIISTICVAIVVFILSLVMLFGKFEKGEAPLRGIVIFILIVQLMSIGHIWN